MATRGNNGNKPDLSDLKARLGLAPAAKPPGAAGPPPGAQPPPGSQGPPGAPQHAPPGAGRTDSPPQAAPAPQQAAPNEYAHQQAYHQESQPSQAYAPQQPAPPAARPGPPKGAKRPKAKRDLSAMPVHDVQIDESVAERSAFSPAILGLLAGVLIVGLVFGYMFAQSSQARGLYDNQTTAAKELAETLEPKVEASQQVVALIESMDSSKPEYEATEKLNTIEFVPDAGTITSRTVYLGGSIVYDVTTFMSKASTFKQLIKRHAELTVLEKDELDQIIAGNELLASDKGFAILYNHKQLLEHQAKNGKDTDYKPAPGRLVAIDEFKVNEEGKVSFSYLNSKNSDTYPVLGIIPIEKNDVLKTEGQENALARYKRRVDTLKRYAIDLKKHVDGVMEPVTDVAGRGGAPFLQLSSPESPSSSTPRAASSPEAQEPEAVED